MNFLPIISRDTARDAGLMPNVQPCRVKTNPVFVTAGAKPQLIIKALVKHPQATHCCAFGNAGGDLQCGEPRRKPLLARNPAG